MSNRNISTKVLNVVYTTEQWKEEPIASTIISKGLAVYETTNDGKLKMKLGDGVNTYSKLPYLSDPSVDEQVMDKLESLTDVLRIKGTVVDFESLSKISKPEAGDLYFVGTEEGSYAEYVRTADGNWECLGVMSNDIDLSCYYNSDQVDALLNNKANNVLSNYINKGDSSDITTTDTISSAFSKVENKLEDKLDSNDTFTFICTL